MKSSTPNVTHLITLRSILIFIFILSFPIFNIINAQSQSDVNTVIKELKGYVKEMKKAKKIGTNTYGYYSSYTALEKTFAKIVKKAGAWDNYNNSWPGWLWLDLSNAGLYSQFGVYGLDDWSIGNGSIALISKSINFVKRYNRYDVKKLAKIRNSIKVWKKNRTAFDKTIFSLMENWAQQSKFLEIGYKAPYTEAGEKIRAEANKAVTKYENAAKPIKTEMLKYTKMPPFESLVEKVYVIKNIVFDGGPLDSYLRFLKDQIDVRIRNYKEYESKSGKEIKNKISELDKRQKELNKKAKNLSEALKKKTNEILSAKRAKLTPLVKAYIGTRKLSQEELTELENKIIASYEKGRHSENAARFKRRDEILKYIDKLNATIKAKTEGDEQLKKLEKLNNEYLKIDDDLWNIKKEQYKLDSDYDIVFYLYDKYREELDKRVEAIDYAQNELKQKLMSTNNAKVKYIFINAPNADVLKAKAASGLEKEYKKFKNLVKKLTKMKKRAKRIKDKTFDNYITALKDSKASGEKLSGWRGLIMKRALTNAAMEFTQNVKDVIIDGGKEGVPGMLAALAGKTVTFIQDYKSGKLTKDDIDYKAIRKRVRKNLADTSKVLATSIDAAKGHVTGELTKLVYENKGLAEYTTDMIKIGLTLDSTSTKKQLQNYYKFAVDLDKKGLAHIKDIAKDKLNKLKENAKKIWNKRNSSIKEIGKDLDQLKIGDKAIREIGKDLVKGAALEFFKTGISAHLKREEINGWTDLFEKEFIAKGLFRVYQDSQIRLNRVTKELQRTRKDLFNLTSGRDVINSYLIDYNKAFFETDLLKLQILSGNMKDINQRVFIDKVEATKTNNDNYTFDAKKLGKDTPEKVDLKILFSPKR